MKLNLQNLHLGAKCQSGQLVLGQHQGWCQSIAARATIVQVRKTYSKGFLTHLEDKQDMPPTLVSGAMKLLEVNSPEAPRRGFHGSSPCQILLASARVRLQGANRKHKSSQRPQVRTTQICLEDLLKKKCGKYIMQESQRMR